MPLKRILTLALYAIVLIIATIGFAKIFNADAFGGEIETMLYDADIISGTNILIVLSVVLILIAALVTFGILPAFGIFIVVQSDRKSFLRTLIGVAALAVVFFIGYSISGNEVTRTYEAMGITTPGQSKLIGGVIYTVFLLIVIGVVAYVYSSISSLLKQL